MSGLNTLADVPVKWECVSEYTTQRDRIKTVLVGIPGPRFWHRWKKTPGFKEDLRDTGISPRRMGGTKDWAVFVWINRNNRDLVEALGFKIPDVVAQDDKPF